MTNDVVFVLCIRLTDIVMIHDPVTAAVFFVHWVTLPSLVNVNVA